MTINQIFWI